MLNHTNKRRNSKRKYITDVKPDTLPRERTINKGTVSQEILKKHKNDKAKLESFHNIENLTQYENLMVNGSPTTLKNTPEMNFGMGLFEPVKQEHRLRVPTLGCSCI